MCSTRPFPVKPTIRNAGQSQPASPIQAEVSPHIALLAMTIDAMQIPISISISIFKVMRSVPEQSHCIFAHLGLEP